VLRRGMLFELAESIDDSSAMYKNSYWDPVSAQQSSLIAHQMLGPLADSLRIDHWLRDSAAIVTHI